jgi:hypothetical protein
MSEVFMLIPPQREASDGLRTVLDCVQLTPKFHCEFNVPGNIHGKSLLGQAVGENYIMRSFITFTLLQV